MQYIIEQCNLVKNPNYSFYLVSIDAKNQFNTFLEQAQKNKQDLKSIHKIFQPPSFYIIRGGYKKDQLKDIERVKRDTKDFPYFNFS